MKYVLIAYFSHSGKTAQMAEYIAEGIRIKGHQATVKSITAIRDISELKNYDGCIFGSPTYSLDIPGPMNNFLSLLKTLDLKGKLAGSFGAYSHEVAYAPGGVAAEKILEMAEKEFRMDAFSLGPLRLKEALVDTVEGMRACQDYGKVFADRLAESQAK
jgi:flavodoxin